MGIRVAGPARPARSCGRSSRPRCRRRTRSWSRSTTAGRSTSTRSSRSTSATPSGCAPHIADTRLLLDQALDAGETVLLEGSQGTLLDVDHGTYPFVTSSNPTAGGACDRLGHRADPDQPGDRDPQGVHDPGRARGRSRPSCSTPTASTCARHGGEVGVTTGRDRRCGWFDSVVARYATRVNGLTDCFLTKLDVLSGPGAGAGLRGVRRRRRPARRDADDADRLPPRQADLRGAAGWFEDTRHCRDLRRPAGQRAGLRPPARGAVAVRGSA